MLTQWLQTAGLSVQRASVPQVSAPQTTAAGGGIDLLALSNGGDQAPAVVWQLRLIPNSALATRLVVLASSFPEQIDALDDLISGYVAGTNANLDTEGLPVPQTVLAKLRAVVCISATADQGDIQITGCIVKYSDHNAILCTAHNFKTARDIHVQLFNGRRYPVELVRMDTDLDLALLRIAKDDGYSLNPMNGRRYPGSGEWVYAVGCPLEMRNTIRIGVLSGPARRYERVSLWQAQLKVQPGSSGSPVFDYQGHLIGLIKGRYRGTDNIGFIIPLDTIMAFLNDMEND